MRGLDPRRLIARRDGAHSLRTSSPRLGARSWRRVALQDERYRTLAVRNLWNPGSSKPLVLILDDLPGRLGTIELLERCSAACRTPLSWSRWRCGPERQAGCGRVRTARAGRLTRHELGVLTLPETRSFGPGYEGAAATALHEDSGNCSTSKPARSQERAPAPHPRPRSADAAGFPPAVVAALTGLGCSRMARPVLRVQPSRRPVRARAGGCGGGSHGAVRFAALDGRCDLARHTDVPRRFRRHSCGERSTTLARGWRSRGAARRLWLPAEPATARVLTWRPARHGDEGAVAVLREAGTAAAQRTRDGGAPVAAALRVLGDGGPEPERVGSLTALAGAQAATGRRRSAGSPAEALSPVEEGTPARPQLTAARSGRRGGARRSGRPAVR